MHKVEVIFEDSTYNYTTSVSEQTTEQDAKKYFVGTFFNFGMGEGGIEDFQKCIAINYTTKNKLK